MYIDSRLAKILSGFFADIAKALFVVTFITPSLVGASFWWEALILLTKGFVGVTLLLVLSWQLSKLEDI